MTWLYYPNKFERIFLDSCNEISQDLRDKNKYFRILADFREEYPEFISGYDALLKPIGKYNSDTTAKTIATISSFPREFPYVDIIGNVNDVNDQLKMKLFNDSKRSTCFSVDFTYDKIDPMDIWYNPRKGISVDYAGEVKDEVGLAHFDWFADIEKIEKIDDKRLSGLIKEGLELS